MSSILTHEAMEVLSSVEDRLDGVAEAMGTSPTEVLALLQRHRTPRCAVQGCNEPAAFEGWVRLRDGFGQPPGPRRRVVVCENPEHIRLLRENQ